MWRSRLSNQSDSHPQTKDNLTEQLVQRHWAGGVSYRLDDERAMALAELVCKISDRGYGDDEIPSVLRDPEVLEQFGFTPDMTHLVAALRVVRRRISEAAG